MVNQANYRDSQTYNIDIDLFYEDFIKQIDDIRGYVNIASPNNLKFLNKITESDFSGISGKLAVESSYQESRLHAFYRLIGFPVLSNNGQYYSPGHDAVIYTGSFLTRKQNKKFKLNVVNNIKSNFYEFSKKREEYYNTKIPQWFSYQDINTSTYLLSTYNTRNFNDHFDKYENVYDFNFDNQSYLVKLSDPLNRSLLEYSFFNSVEETKPTKLISKRNHNIFPFLVDPRLDLSASKRVCVPFPLNINQTFVSEVYQAPRCLLESIIMERFSPEKESITYTKELNSFVKEFIPTNDEYLIDKINKTSEYSNSDRDMFIKLLNLINSMVDKLIEAKKDIDFVISNTYWLPICSKNGFDGKLNSILLPLTKDSRFKTSFDNELALFQRKLILESIVPQSEDTVDSSGFGLPQFISSISDFASRAFGSYIKQSSEDLSRQKVFFDSKGAEALKTIEVIMGEFSGLGLCDILAILGGLYLVDKKYLLGLIDQDSYTRFIKKTKAYDTDQPSIDESMEQLNKVVYSFYNIMQKTYMDKIKFGL